MWGGKGQPLFSSFLPPGDQQSGHRDDAPGRVILSGPEQGAQGVEEEGVTAPTPPPLININTQPQTLATLRSWRMFSCESLFFSSIPLPATLGLNLQSRLEVKHWGSASEGLVWSGVYHEVTRMERMWRSQPPAPPGVGFQQPEVREPQVVFFYRTGVHVALNQLLCPLRLGGQSLGSDSAGLPSGSGGSGLGLTGASSSQQTRLGPHVHIFHLTACAEIWQCWSGYLSIIHSNIFAEKNISGSKQMTFWDHLQVDVIDCHVL